MIGRTGIAIASIAAAVAAAIAWRRRVATRFERRVERLHPVGALGIIPGAEPIVHDRAGAPAVLLIHGGGDTPQTLRYLAADLVAHGFAVHAPLLPGHGRTLRSFARASADAWYQRVREEYAAMTASYDWVAVVGLSMGGALAARLAAERTPPALVLLSPYVSMPRRIARAARLAPLWGLVVPYVDAKPTAPSIFDEAEATRSLGYGAFSASALRALYDTMRAGFAALALIKAPTLMMQSRDDGRISVPDAERAFEQIGAHEKRIIWLEGIGHVMTVDRGREAVFAAVRDWLDRHRVAARALA